MPPKSKYINSKRRHIYVGPQSWYAAIFELIRSIIKPKVKFNLSIEETPLLYSISNDINENYFKDGQHYFLLAIKCERKPIGNFELDVIGHFYGKDKKNIDAVLSFEGLPEVIEPGEEILLKSLTEIDFNSLLSSYNKIVINFKYDYAFAGRLKTVKKQSIWSFGFENGYVKVMNAKNS